MRIAVLFRGEAYRWGCDARSITFQARAYRSHMTQLILPLEAARHTVDVFLAVGGGPCSSSPDLANTTLGARVRRKFAVVGATQAVAIRSALNGFFHATSSTSSGWPLHDWLVVTRHDLTLLHPLIWDQTSTSVHLASPCEGWRWMQYNCSSDILFLVPSRHMAAVNSSFGYSRFASSLTSAGTPRKPRFSHYAHCCFHAACIGHGSGHGCYSVIGSTIGFTSIVFLWPPPIIGSTLAHHQPYYLLPACTDTPAASQMWRCPKSKAHLAHATKKGPTTRLAQSGRRLQKANGRKVQACSLQGHERGCVHDERPRIRQPPGGDGATPAERMYEDLAAQAAVDATPRPRWMPPPPREAPQALRVAAPLPRRMLVSVGIGPAYEASLAPLRTSASTAGFDGILLWTEAHLRADPLWAEHAAALEALRLIGMQSRRKHRSSRPYCAAFKPFALWRAMQGTAEGGHVMWADASKYFPNASLPVTRHGSVLREAIDVLRGRRTPPPSPWLSRRWRMTQWHE